MQKPRQPNIGELIEHTEADDTAAVRAWLGQLTPPEQDAFSAIIQRYPGLHANVSKVAVFHALQEYASKHGEGASAQETEDGILISAEATKDQLLCIENAISSSEKVVVRNDRSENLGQSSAVLNSHYAVCYPYGVLGKNTIIDINNDGKTVTVHPILMGVKSAKEAKEGKNARWAINQNAVEARFEQWCDDINKPSVLDEQLVQMIKKRAIMRVFNTYIDVVQETESTFLQSNELLQKMIAENREIIIEELVSQLEKHSTAQLDGQVIKKYLTAFDVLHHELTDEILCDIIADETSDEELATSQLYEAV